MAHRPRRRRERPHPGVARRHPVPRPSRLPVPVWTGGLVDQGRLHHGVRCLHDAWREGSRLMKGGVIGVLILAGTCFAEEAVAQRPSTGSHAIYMTAVEFKGSTTADKLAPPPRDPARMSRGYVYK